jgi:prephenate dehydrogenase
VREALDRSAGLVTDVGSVKTPMLGLMDDPRYVGGHPMAGSELEGVDGARADLFEGATWVLTPTPGTDDAAFATIRAVVSSFGADVVALPPDQHDEMVAIVSHLPHLTAATLMRLADDSSTEHRAVLRLAAGGFRDMTRIAAGHPGIWPDICAENRVAIVGQLDRLIAALGEVRATVAAGDRQVLVQQLEQARTARMALPARVQRPEDLTEIRVPIPDRKGVLAQILTLATELDVSIADIEIAHSTEGPQGVLLLLVESVSGPRLRDGLAGAGFKPSLRALE